MYRKFNSLSTDLVEGVRYDTLLDMKSTIFGFYNSLFSDSEPWRSYVDWTTSALLWKVDKESIEMPFNEDEVTKAFLDCYGDKSSGPDGMTMAFLYSNWGALGGDMMSMLAKFFCSGKFVASMNTTFISLILKKTNAVDIRDFWPISLDDCIYKLLSKVLAQRLRSVIGPGNQNAFVGGC